ncbi:uncharacterized protein BXZ73DRAFT_95677 [Epithele typhae]|uniref:uncharacterized protein n=1 Tax=Epithele typhae TaxID=378194 RepID=UPI002008DAF1|nr:uncharacterized protein BXZ73DRAFT_95677 [Epithele typhae]KAH9946179.1 hypothetical protein BXZ73DRAFT_95677 [Epithele typhae]
MSSSGSDMFDRSGASVASSRTSLDSREMDEKMDDKPASGAGSSLWSNITTVASGLSNWYKNSPAVSGEGNGESHLTRVMKAYYIDKARGPADLPEWLFDERERGLRSRDEETPRSSRDEPRSTGRGRDERELELEPVAVPPPRPRRGLTLADRQQQEREQAQAQAQSRGARRPARSRYDDDDEPAQPVTKAASRLRELRDAKRAATARVEEPVHYDEPEPMRYEPEPRRRMAPGSRGPGTAAPLGVVGMRGRPGVGLPSGVRARA